MEITPGLYLVSTPIGNLEDISHRAVRILNSVDMIYCEDTRVSKKLLNHYQIKKQLFVYNDFSGEISRNEILSILMDDKAVALISDAGTPLISDPGYKLVKLCKQKKIPIYTIPGPSALTSSVVVSGLPTDKIYFLGFLPGTASKRKNELQKIKKLDATVVIFESAKKIYKTLNEIQNYFGDIEIVITRELTKIFEEVITNKISNILSEINNKSVKGEMVILFNTSELITNNLDITEVENDIRKLINDLPVKQIANMIHMKYDLPKKMVYDLCLKSKKTK
ncbi:MAG: 16S rRNA (cytidine(1402)-2'-O)-methyltransferase [Rhodobiaceae bacterium]|nr:16S rRNA (cytidine(1402)-2'-O)-methyltransferase [Rhodobiaceae bacterium]|tara:strand:+ start:18580 stop:19419 length:840 start_codon:yes stop_codon:yes gene_type:complete